MRKERGVSMIETTTRRRNAVATAVRVLLVVEAVAFLLAALVHLGMPIPLGLAEPRIVPATIAEGLSGLFFTVSAYAGFARRTWAWPLTTAAHAFARAG